jgi:hypothetical protein
MFALVGSAGCGEKSTEGSVDQAVAAEPAPPRVRSVTIDGMAYREWDVGDLTLRLPADHPASLSRVGGFWWLRWPDLAFPDNTTDANKKLIFTVVERTSPIKLPEETSADARLQNRVDQLDGPRRSPFPGLLEYWVPGSPEKTVIFAIADATYVSPLTGQMPYAFCNPPSTFLPPSEWSGACTVYGDLSLDVQYKYQFKRSLLEDWWSVDHAIRNYVQSLIVRR